MTGKDCDTPFETQYLARTEKSRARRLQWFTEARFGMFIHWGLYSQLGRGEWAMNLDRIPVEEYETLAATWKPQPGCAREWAHLAKAAGMKYMVLTTKHHEGFCLWDTQQTDYNAVKQGPQRDLVREYVEAARAEGLKVGFYYSLMDWHHPDGIRCARDEAARQRFTAFTQGCVRELLSNYGTIDILWYDVSWPLKTPQAWDSYRLNAMARKLQPHILINDRSQIPEDFGTPEEHVTAATGDRAWEACMTFNGAWGWMETPPEEWLSARKVIDMLRTCTGGGGNLLLNIGPHPDGSVPKEAVERLTTIGRWLNTYGDVIYGKVDRASIIGWPNFSAYGNWTRKGNTMYFWCSRWPERDFPLAGVVGKLVSARVYPDGTPLVFTQTEDLLLIQGLPANCPDTVAQVGMLELKFRTPPRQYFNFGPVLPEVMPADLSGPNVSPPVATWQRSELQPKPVGGVAAAQAVALSAGLGWAPVRGGGDGFVNVHDFIAERDGLIYFGNRLTVPRDGTWRLHLGHDGGICVFVDGKAVFCEPALYNPSVPGRSSTMLKLAKGPHELVIAFDTCAGRGWGIFVHFEAVGAVASRRGGKPLFPAV
jgi:alpha-L-fucosidase